MMRGVFVAAILFATACDTTPVTDVSSRGDAEPAADRGTSHDAAAPPADVGTDAGEPCPWSVEITGATDGPVELCGAEALRTNTPGEITALALTAIHPFNGSTFIGCEQIGVFPPTSTIDRKNTPLAGVDEVLIDRDTYALSSGAPWQAAARSFPPNPNNPWRVVTFFVEARGPADNGGRREDASLLAGCVCVRNDASASHADANLDRRVKAACGPPISRLTIELDSVVPAAFELIDDWPVAVAGRSGEPVVAPTRIGASTCTSHAPPCFECATATCDELSDTSHVPVILSRGDALVSKPTLTQDDGIGRPETLEPCTPGIVFGSVYGRTGGVELDVSCSPSVRFTRLPDELGLDSAVTAIATLPGAPNTPDRVASFTDGGRVGVHRYDGSALVAEASATFPQEQILGLIGYRYGDTALLAVATQPPGGANQSMRVRLLEVGGNQLIERRSWNAPCATCDCDGACTCGQTTNLGARATFDASDRDGDGFADLSVGLTTDFVLTTFYSRIDASSPPQDRAYPPALDQRCGCQRFGKLLTTYALTDLGGIDPASNHDIVIGDVTGAFAGYASGPTLACEQPATIWRLVNVRAVASGRFTDSGFGDVVALASTSPAPDANDSGRLRVIFGGSTDLSRPLRAMNDTFFDLTVPDTARGPAAIQVADFNGDDIDDVAVLYQLSEEVRVWLGAGGRALAEPSIRVALAGCEPRGSMAVGDIDDDGNDDLTVVCTSGGNPRLRAFRTSR